MPVSDPFTKRFAQALETYVAAAKRDDEPVEIVLLGEAASQAFRDLDEHIRETTNWSNPIRHYHALDDVFWNDPPPVTPPPGVAELATDLKIKVHYSVSIGSEDEFVQSVVERFGLAEPTGLWEAVKMLLIADGWDPSRYPGTRFNSAKLKGVYIVGGLRWGEALMCLTPAPPA